MDKTFKTIKLIDVFESFIWTDRYNSFGDFEIYTPVDIDILSAAQISNYVWIRDSQHLMIIDEKVIISDVENGDRLVLRGQSLESILKDRIIWYQTVLSGNFQNNIQRLLNNNIINASNVSRNIPNFVFQASTDPRITSLNLSAQYTGDNLYEVIEALCKERNLGFKIVLNSQNQFVFSLYMGADRSYNQEINPYVIFSPNFDNLINSNYLESNRVLKNTALVAGEGEGIARRTTTIGGGTGLNRKEMFVDARDITSKTEEEPIPDHQYMAQLTQRGLQKMVDNAFIKSFEGDIETTRMFVYNQDFFLGDVVQISNDYGLEASSRIVEIIFSNNNSGYNIVPTFNIVE